jgi:hypothetical protein
MIDLVFTTHGEDALGPDPWLILVQLSRRYLELPRLVELFGRVQGGETVEVAGLRIHRAGFDCGTVSLPWQSVREPQRTGDQVLIYQTGESEPVLAVPLETPNAVLAWQLVNLFASVRG